MDKLWFKARRVISVLLVFAMLASLTPVQVFAEDGETAPVTETTEPAAVEESVPAETEQTAEPAAEGGEQQEAQAQEPSTEAAGEGEAAAPAETPAQDPEPVVEETPVSDEQPAAPAETESERDACRTGSPGDPRGSGSSG